MIAAVTSMTTIGIMSTTTSIGIGSCGGLGGPRQGCAFEHLARNEPTKLALIARGFLPADETERPRTEGSGPLLPTDLLEGQRLEGIGRLAESNTARFVAQPVSAPDGLWHGAKVGSGLPSEPTSGPP